jgi:hypothetical protein
VAVVVGVGLWGFVAVVVGVGLWGFVAVVVVVAVGVAATLKYFARNVVLVHQTLFLASISVFEMVDLINYHEWTRSPLSKNLIGVDPSEHLENQNLPNMVSMNNQWTRRPRVYFCRWRFQQDPFCRIRPGKQIRSLCRPGNGGHISNA